jgi:protein tyrosine/serine phosphatase
MRRLLPLTIGLAALLCGRPMCLADTTTNSSRPTTWATPLHATNLSNFFMVTTNLYRGAQPNAKGMAELKSYGVRTVFNLRSFHSDTSELKGLDFKPARLHMKPWHAEEDDVVSFLKIAADTNNCPVFVHCQRGADRTGLVCAMYRIVICGWTKHDAMEEMTEGGFKFDPRWKNIVHFIEQADIEEIRRRAGLEPAGTVESLNH